MRRNIAFLFLMTGVVFMAQAQWSTNENINNAICTAGFEQSRVQSVSDGSGGAIITWEDNRGGAGLWYIYAQRIDASGVVKWQANGVSICTAIGEHRVPTIASDNAGGAIITWMGDRGQGFNVYAQRVGANGSPLWIANGVAICVNPGNASNPTITGDNASGAIITWLDYRNGGGGENFDIYAQRVDANGVVQWIGNGIPICNAARDQLFPNVVNDNAGGAIITWKDYRSGTNFDIYAQRIDLFGAPLWAVNGVAICTAGNNQDQPVMISDNAGGAVIAWRDLRAVTNYDIYAQRVNAGGNIQWTADGLAICIEGTGQFSPAITSDNANGAIITWADLRNGPARDIYAQRVNATGNPLWIANGVAICTAGMDQTLPVITGESSGGAVIAWQDYRNGANYDIYAQRLNASGMTQWAPNGVAISTASGDQQRATIVGDGAGGAIIAWEDSRTAVSGLDIYAQKINRNGLLGDLILLDPLILRPPCFPNPICFAFRWGQHPGGSPLVTQYAIHRDITPNFTPASFNMIGTTTDTTFNDLNANYAETQYYKVVMLNEQMVMIGISSELKNTDALLCRANIRSYLEGPYNATQEVMSTALNPTLQSRWSTFAVPPDAVDSIAIELRDSIGAVQSTIRKFRPAWLSSDGTIRMFDDTTKHYVEFTDAPAGDYYIVVHHRNHLAVMSSSLQNASGTVPMNPTDFTHSSTSAYGINAMKQIGSRFVLIAGDANGNGQIANSDINSVIRPSLGQSGYKNGDTNLNGQVTNTDIISFVKPNIGKGTQVPNAPTTGGNSRKEH